MSTPASTASRTGNADEGESDVFGYAIRAVKTQSGAVLELPGPGSVVAVVGANNVGKSTFLSEIAEVLSAGFRTQAPARQRVVAGLDAEWIGSPEAMEGWLRANKKIDREASRRGVLDPLTQAMDARRQSPFPGIQWKWIVNYQNAFDRIAVCNPVARLDHIGARPSHPFHHLLVNADARKRVQDLADRLFGAHLELDLLSGKVGFAIGDPGLPAPPVNNVSTEYAQALAALPKLNEQGDGMRSALGLLIPLITDGYPVSLIDEPEAFLHPPQARTLGAEVAKLAFESRTQVILATHDKNFLQGLVETGIPTAIIHLSRSGDETAAQLLDTKDVSELWTDTTLRYGNALEGLFHSAVIITENDRDSRFYAAAVDHKRAEASPLAPSHNVMFMGANGKTSLAGIANRLGQLGVRVVSCPDLDILDDEAVLAKLVSAHGGEWSALKSRYLQATAQFRQPTAPVTTVAVKSLIDKVFTDCAGEIVFSKELARKVTDAIKISTRWAELKRSGTRAFRTEKAAAIGLLEDLDKLGIVCVRVGELENFLETADASKGPNFLEVAFASGAHKTHEAHQHANRLLIAAGVAPG